MKERPILFTGEMVHAILDGRKTQTRRLVKPQPFEDPKWGLSWAPRGIANNKPIYCERNANFNPITKAMLGVGAPLGTIGDRLWVRETWAPHCEMPGAAIYRCDRGGDYQDTVTENFRWRHSIHMPRWASRIDLEITAVRVERVQDITEEDARKEGIVESDVGRAASKALATYKRQDRPPLVLQFADLWQSIYGNRPTLPKNTESKRYHRVKRWLDRNPPTGWDVNPWVWVYEFRRIKP